MEATLNNAPVYMIIMLDIPDVQAFFAEYVNPLQAHHEKYGVETLVASPSPEVLEGSYAKSLTVVLKLPSAQAQHDWCHDPDYQPLLKRRFELTDPSTSVALLLPEFQS